MTVSFQNNKGGTTARTRQSVCFEDLAVVACLFFLNLRACMLFCGQQFSLYSVLTHSGTFLMFSRHVVAADQHFNTVKMKQTQEIWYFGFSHKCLSQPHQTTPFLKQYDMLPSETWLNVNK